MSHDERHSMEPLDPVHRDPGYWHRFHRTVMERAAPELARLEARAAATVSDVVFEWGRAVVPAALLAATLAAMLLVQEPTFAPSDPGDAGIEELLAGGLDDDPIPVVLASEVAPASSTMEEF